MKDVKEVYKGGKEVKKNNEIKQRKTDPLKINYIIDIIDFVLVITGFIFALITKESPAFPYVITGTLLFVIVRIAIMVFRITTLPKYRRLLRQEKYSHETFLALQKANSRKTQEVMRYTYGKVAKWNPINYYRNLVTYDIHEQIRSILISLRDLIIDMDETGRLNSDNVTVDLLYCYKPFLTEDNLDGNSFTCRLTPKNEAKNTDTKCTNDAEPRLISSGDYDLEKPPRNLFYDSCSFYWYARFEKGGYCFSNDKNSLNPCIRNDNAITLNGCEDFHYIVTKKDLRYETDVEIENSNRRIRKKANKINEERDRNQSKKYTRYPLVNPGSIVCSFFNLHNDVPSEICVSAVLSIATYGQKLCLNDKDISSFKEDFRSKVLHSYKSLLVSELAQMYIRHSVNNGTRNPVTGETVTNTNGSLAKDSSEEKDVNTKIENMMKSIEYNVNKTYNDIWDKKD